MTDSKLDELRKQIDEINFEILDLLNKRASVALEVALRKTELGISGFDPMRESGMLADLADHNNGPFSDEAVQTLFKSIFRVTLELMNASDRKSLLVSRQHRRENTVINVNGVAIGADPCVMLAGPCSVESRSQLRAVASHLAQRQIKIMRGGAFKPRSSPYSFQGLGLEGLKLLREVADEFGLAIVSEVLDPRDVEAVSPLCDILQIGARNMYNYPLLKEVGRLRQPILLKRSFAATLEELLLSAEYIFSQGNEQIILCERGIRTFETWSRSTLDISSIPLLKQESHLPVLVDVSHAAGRRDILPSLAQAAAAAGADALMVEVHNNPAIALSDNQQQLDLPSFDQLLDAVRRITLS